MASNKHPKASDRAALSSAVNNLIVAAGLDPQHPQLAATPERVAKLWAEEFLSGYAMDPGRILRSEPIATANKDAVFVFDMAFHAMCPHHLLPYQGKAHVAYAPNGRVVGFGRLSRLVGCYTRRLTLQECATRQIADALMEHLDARGAACVLEAHHQCLGIPHDQHACNRVVTSAFAGLFEERVDLRQRLLR